MTTKQTKLATVGLEAYIEKSIELSLKNGYRPTTFIAMRKRHGTIDAISRLVRTGDIQSGFRRLNELGLLDWTIETAITKFPDEFTREDIECAQWRLGECRRVAQKNAPS